MEFALQEPENRPQQWNSTELYNFISVKSIALWRRFASGEFQFGGSEIFATDPSAFITDNFQF